MTKDKISIRVNEQVYIVLQYMRQQAGCTMSNLVNTILRNACDNFNKTGSIPITPKTSKNHA